MERERTATNTNWNQDAKNQPNRADRNIDQSDESGIMESERPRGSQEGAEDLEEGAEGLEEGAEDLEEGAEDLEEGEA
jgi:hypothetical protein